MEIIRPLLANPNSSTLMDQFTDFLSMTCQNAFYYALLYRALQEDQGISEMIEEVAKPFGDMADFLMQIKMKEGQDSWKILLDPLDHVIAEFRAIIEGRACLLPEKAEELSKHYVTLWTP